jgi:site-specific recombinase XerD
MDWLGAPDFIGKQSSFKSSKGNAQAATTFSKARNISLEGDFTSGHFGKASERFIDNQIARALQPSTRKSRKTALTQFYAFLKATDSQNSWKTPSMTEKPLHKQRKEEEILAKFALARFVAGDAQGTVSQKISHIRMGYLEMHFLKFGKGGEGTKSYTSRFIKSMSRFFPAEKKPTEERLPLMDENLLLVYNSCTWKNQMQKQAAILTAFEGLFRMSELCPRDKIFKPKRHLCENDIEFYPSFKDATHITMFMGPSKADQDARKAKIMPRTLLIRNDGTMSAGRCIKSMLITRHNMTGDEDVFIPTHEAPLFQNTQGGHLRAKQIESTIHSALRQGGVRNYKQFNTHSLRIGGTTKLCQLGCPIRLIKLLGGWSSNCVRIYIREDAKSANKFTRNMTSQANSRRKSMNHAKDSPGL